MTRIGTSSKLSSFFIVIFFILFSQQSFAVCVEVGDGCEQNNRDGIINGKLWCREVEIPEAKNEIVGVWVRKGNSGEIDAEILYGKSSRKLINFQPGHSALPVDGYLGNQKNNSNIFSSTPLGGNVGCFGALFHSNYYNGDVADGFTVAIVLEKPAPWGVSCRDDDGKYISSFIKSRVYGNGYCVREDGGGVVCGIGGYGRGYIFRLDENNALRCPFKMPVVVARTSEITDIIDRVALEQGNFQGAMRQIDHLVIEGGK